MAGIGDGPTLKQSKEDVEKKFQDLITQLNKYCKNPRKCDISVIYHVTPSEEKKNDIIKDNQLKQHLARPLKGKSPKPSIYNMQLEGVFFTFNLDPTTKQLPDASPYGTERVQIPITNFKEYEIFFSNRYHTWGFKSKSLVYYVILVMIEKNHEKYKCIEAALPKLDDLTDTATIVKHSVSKPYYYDWHAVLEEGSVKCFNAYFEVFVVGDVDFDDLGRNAKWDHVKKTERAEDKQV